MNELEQLNIPRIECLILKMLKNNYADTYVRSMSAMEILEQIKVAENLSVDTIKKHIRLLKEAGFVAEGAKISRAKGYVLTNKGAELIPAPTKKMED